MPDFVWFFFGGGIMFSLLLYGWPRFFTINIHRHYHGKDEDAN